MDAEMTTLLENLRLEIKRTAHEIELDTKNMFWTPVELVKTSFPEKKISSLKWLRHFGYYNLNLQQLEEGRSVPYGMMAREIFDYFFNNFVVNMNQQKENPHRFYFSSTAEFVNLVKGNELGTKVSTDQRVKALEMLLNMESCAIRFKQSLPEGECITNNNFFIKQYRGPAHKDLSHTPNGVTSGEIEIELDFETFMKLATSKRVPTRSYLVKLAGASVTARDLIILIASQCYSLHKRNAEFLDLNYSELKNILGKEDSHCFKEFSKDIKRAVELLKKNYEELFIYDFFPAEIVSRKRKELILRIYKPKQAKNIICA